MTLRDARRCVRLGSYRLCLAGRQVERAYVAARSSGKAANEGIWRGQAGRRKEEAQAEVVNCCWLAGGWANASSRREGQARARAQKKSRTRLHCDYIHVSCRGGLGAGPGQATGRTALFVVSYSRTAAGLRWWWWSGGSGWGAPVVGLAAQGSRSPPPLRQTVH